MSSNYDLSNIFKRFQCVLRGVGNLRYYILRRDIIRKKTWFLSREWTI